MTEKRNRLIADGGFIIRAANERLNAPENVEKGDNWASVPLHTLLYLLRREEQEVEDAADEYSNLMTPAEVKDWQRRILMECGDVLNFMRMLCDKLGALHPNVLKVTVDPLIKFYDGKSIAILTNDYANIEPHYERNRYQNPRLALLAESTEYSVDMEDDKPYTFKFLMRWSDFHKCQSYAELTGLTEQYNNG